MLYFDFINPYLWYITIIILYFTSVFFIFLRKDFITRNQNYIRVFIMVLLIWSQLARYGFSIIRDGFNPEIYFPFFICRISSLVLTYYFITKDRKVESFLFYWGILGVAGVLYPNGPISNIANLTETFYIDHV